MFTRDPRHIGDVEILKAMIAIRGVYERHEVVSLNHGVGFDTAAIELLLPTYGEKLGLKGRIARHWVLNPHPTLIPSIESGWVESIHSFGGESGMNRYAAARPDVFFTGADGSLRSNRVLAQLAGQYAIDMFIGSSLQIDADANSSTVTDGRLSGFGGAPNMGHDPHGRRHSTTAWLDLANGDGASRRGRKLVVQMAQTFRAGGVPTFVETLDAVEVGRQADMPPPPVMIYGDDVSHVVTEEGVAYLYKAHSLADRRAALAAVAGVTPVGRRAEARRTEALRGDGLVAFPRGPQGRDTARQPIPAGRPQHRRPRRLVGRALRSARTVQVVVAAIEQGFQGGGTGEVSGAKISQALLLAAADSRAGTPTAAIILFETGGVRLQEANLGLNAVAEICSTVLDLRPLAPVIGVVAGTVGSFGGMSIAAGLCTRVIVTPQARIGLNGPAVIEQEGGVDEFDSSDHALIWAVDGGEQRRATALADALVPDDADQLRAAVLAAIKRRRHRTRSAPQPTSRRPGLPARHAEPRCSPGPARSPNDVGQYLCFDSDRA